MRQPFLVLLLLLNCFFFLRCSRPCEDLAGLENSSMVIYPFNNATGNYIYPENTLTTPSPFKRDSLRVINENGQRFSKVSFGLNQDPRNPLQKFYAIQLSPAFIVPDDNDAFSQERSRKIYLKYDAQTIDTLLLVFKARRTNKCNRSEYEYLKVYHRNTIIASVDRGTFIDFTLNH